MNFRNSLAVGALAGSALLPLQANASDRHENSLVFGLEVNTHLAAAQAKYLRSTSHNVAIGALTSFGVDTHKNPVFGLEALVAFSAHIHDNVAMVLEGTIGLEFIKDGDEVGSESVYKAALLGEYSASPTSHVKLYAGPYIGRVGHDLRVGGSAGVVIDL